MWSLQRLPALVVVVVVFSIQGNAQGKTLSLGLLFPITNHGAPQRAAGAILAIRHVNARVYSYVRQNSTVVPNGPPAIHPDLQITYTLSDTGADPRRGFLSASTAINDDKVHGIIGASSSSVSTPVAWVCEKSSIPQISYASTAAVLSDKSKFPFFTRTVPADNEQGEALVKLVSQLGWRHVATVSHDSTYGLGIIQDFTTKATDAGIEVSSLGSFKTGATVAEIQAYLDQALVENPVRIIIAAASGSDASNLAKAVTQTSRLVSPHYQWVGTDGIMQQFIFEGLTSPQLLSGMLGVAPEDGSETPLHVDFLQSVWYQQSPQDFNTPQFSFVNHNDFRTPMNTLTPFAYDAVWAFALAASSMMYRGEDLSNGATLLRRIKEVTFTGITGPVSFDSAGDRLPVYTVLNLQQALVGNITISRIGDVRASAFELHSHATPVFANGATTPPADRLSKEERDIGPGTSLRAGLIATAGVLMVVTAVVGALIFLKRATVLIKRSTPAFLYIALSGCVLAYISVMIGSLPPSNFLCNTRIVLLIPAFTLTFGSLFTKSYRIQKIFNSGAPSYKPMSTMELVYALAGMLAIDFVLVTLWVAIAPLHSDRVRETGLAEIVTVARCTRSKGYSIIFIGAIVFYKLGLIMWGATICFKLRKVYMRDFNESKYISYAIYNLLILAFVVIPVLIAVGSNVHNESTLVLLTATSVMLAAFSTTVFVFTPKIYYLYIKKLETFGTKENGLTTSISIHRGGSRTRKSNADSSRLQSQISLKDQQLTAKEEELTLLRQEVQALREEKKGWDDATQRKPAALESEDKIATAPDTPPSALDAAPSSSSTESGPADTNDHDNASDGTAAGLDTVAERDVIDSNPERALVDSNPEESGIRL